MPSRARASKRQTLVNWKIPSGRDIATGARGWLQQRAHSVSHFILHPCLECHDQRFAQRRRKVKDNRPIVCTGELERRSAKRTGLARECPLDRKSVGNV
jgi:hypothetical protein